MTELDRGRQHSYRVPPPSTDR
ncbi:hypothetical protein DXT90_21185 [Agrobacterium tumefaciens]|nr:hypothetical protein [Agrobacterium tumefaciens]